MGRLWVALLAVASTIGALHTDQELRIGARQFLHSMDADGNGKASRSEMVRQLQQSESKGFKELSVPGEGAEQLRKGLERLQKLIPLPDWTEADILQRLRTVAKHMPPHAYASWLEHGLHLPRLALAAREHQLGGESLLQLLRGEASFPHMTRVTKLDFRNGYVGAVSLLLRAVPCPVAPFPLVVASASTAASHEPARGAASQVARRLSQLTGSSVSGAVSPSTVSLAWKPSKVPRPGEVSQYVIARRFLGAVLPPDASALVKRLKEARGNHTEGAGEWSDGTWGSNPPRGYAVVGATPQAAFRDALGAVGEANRACQQLLSQDISRRCLKLWAYRVQAWSWGGGSAWSVPVVVGVLDRRPRLLLEPPSVQGPKVVSVDLSSLGEEEEHEPVGGDHQPPQQHQQQQQELLSLLERYWYDRQVPQEECDKPAPLASDTAREASPKRSGWDLFTRFLEVFTVGASLLTAVAYYLRVGGMPHQVEAAPIAGSTLGGGVHSLDDGTGESFLFFEGDAHAQEHAAKAPQPLAETMDEVPFSTDRSKCFYCHKQFGLRSVFKFRVRHVCGQCAKPFCAKCGSVNHSAMVRCGDGCICNVCLAREEAFSHRSGGRQFIPHTDS
jgi:hypothetical protein